MKKDLIKVRKKAWETLKLLEDKKIGVLEAKTIARHHSNLISSCIAQIQCGKNVKE